MASFDDFATGAFGEKIGIGNAFGDYGKAFMGDNDYDPRKGISYRAPYQKQIGMDRANQLGSRAGQTELGGAIMDRAMGRGGPSVAEKQMQAGLAQAQGASMAQAASARGVNRGLMQREAMRGQAALAANANRDASMLRAQEQIAAQGLASQHLAQQRMADLQALGYSLDEAKAVLDAEMKAKGMMTQISEGDAERGQKGAGGISTLVSGFLSDIRAKEDIRPAPSRVAPEAMNATRFYSPELMAAGGPVMSGPSQATGVVDPYAIDRQMTAQRESRDMAREASMAQSPAPAQRGDGSFLDNLAGGLQGAGAILSDARAKEDARAFVPRQAFKNERYAEAASGFETIGDHYLAAQSHELSGNKAAAAAQYLRALSSGKLDKDQTGRAAERLQMLGIKPEKVKPEPQPKSAPASKGSDLRAATTPKGNRQALAPMNAYEFKYKPEAAAAFGHDTAPRIGIMAQEAERSPLYASTVVQGPGGVKMIDPVRKDQADTAAIAGLDKRLAAVEGGRLLPSKGKDINEGLPLKMLTREKGGKITEADQKRADSILAEKARVDSIGQPVLPTRRQYIEREFAPMFEAMRSGPPPLQLMDVPRTENPYGPTRGRYWERADSRARPASVYDAYR